MATLRDFRIGQRVQMHPATDLWMQGARYGNVVNIGRKYVAVRLDCIKRIVYVAPSNLLDAGE